MVNILEELRQRNQELSNMLGGLQEEIRDLKNQLEVKESEVEKKEKDFVDWDWFSYLQEIKAWASNEADFNDYEGYFDKNKNYRKDMGEVKTKLRSHVRNFANPYFKNFPNRFEDFIKTSLKLIGFYEKLAIEFYLENEKNKKVAIESENERVKVQERYDIQLRISQENLREVKKEEEKSCRLEKAYKEEIKIHLEALELGGKKRNEEVGKRDRTIKIKEKKIKQFQKHLQTLTKNYSKVNNGLQQKLVKAEAKTKRQEKINFKYRTLTDNIQKLDESKKEVIRKLNQKEVTIQNLTNDKNQLSQDLNQKNEILRKKNISINNKQAQISQLKGEKDALITQKELVEKEVEVIQEKYNQLKAEKNNWQQREKELLAEIELLKNPPSSENKENIALETEKYQSEVKVLVEKLPTEQIRTINLVWQEAKNKYNQQLTKLQNQLTTSKNNIQRERERERDKNPLNSHFGINNSNYGKNSIVN